MCIRWQLTDVDIQLLIESSKDTGQSFRRSTLMDGGGGGSSSSSSSSSRGTRWRS